MGQELVGNLSLIVSGVAVKLGYHTRKLYQVGFHFLKFISKDDLFLSNPNFMKLVLVSLYTTIYLQRKFMDLPVFYAFKIISTTWF